MAANETVRRSGAVDKVVTKRASAVQFNVPSENVQEIENESQRKDVPTQLSLAPQTTQDATGQTCMLVSMDINL